MTRIRAAAWLRPAAAMVSLVLLGVAYLTPIWVSRLDAPQYPQGLWLVVWAGRMTGDVSEVNELNHYIGMRIVSPEAVPELGLWWLAVASSLVFALGALVLTSFPALLARIGAWLVPVVTIVDIQRWLYVFGHDLSKDAALRMKPFTPLAIGPTKVWNFEILSLPGPGLLLLVLVALIVTLTPRRPGPARRPRVGMGAAVAAVLLLTLALTGCAPAGAADHVGADAHVHPVTEPGTSHAQHVQALPAGGTFDIAAAIAAAPEGATIHVPPGRYPPLLVERPVVLHAEGDAVIDGGGHGHVVTIAAAGVTFEGFVVANSGGQVEDGAGIYVHADGVTVRSNTIRDAYVGVLARDTKGLKVVGNVIVGPGAPESPESVEVGHLDASAVGDGIWLHATESTLVRDNDITRMRDGLYLSYATATLVDRNKIHDLRYGLHAMFGSGLMIFGNTVSRNASGLVLMNTADLEASRNLIVDHRSDATGYGLLLKDTTGVRLVENVIERNAVGLRAEGVDRALGLAEALKNRIAYNVVGLQLFPTARLVFSRNTFTDNAYTVDTPGATLPNGSEWMKSGAGNTWGSYAGYDLDGDGIGDVAYVDGSTAQRLVTALPELRAFRGSLAFAILARGERWWTLAQAPRVVDRAPLVVSVAPAGGAPAHAPADAAAFGGLGIVLIGAALAARRAIR